MKKNKTMSDKVTEPILLDKTGQEMIKRLYEIAEAIKKGSPGGGIPEAPIDDNTYGRRKGTWKKIEQLLGDAIIDVDELPTEDIKNVFYRVASEEALYVRLGDKWVRIIGKPNDYTSIKRIAQYLYDVTYEQTVTEEEAEDYLAHNYSEVPVGKCTSLAGEGFGIHLLDWYLTYLAEFRIYTPADGGQREIGSHSMGGNSPFLPDDFVASGRYSDKYKWLPYTVVDGVNDAGVFATVNVVSSLDGERTTGTNPGLPRMCAMRVVRYVLDHFTTAYDAVQALAYKYDIYAPQGAVNDEFHWIIADGKQKFILECVGNKAVIIDKTEYARIWMTNFRLSGVEFDEDGYVVPETVEPHGQGVERYNLVNDYRDYPISLKNLAGLGSELRFSRAYTDSSKEDPDLPMRKTDFCGIYSGGEEDLTVTTPAEAYRRVWGIARERWDDPEKRDKGLVWQTEHMAIYDLANKSLTLFIQEDFKTSYSFQLGGQVAGDDKTTLVYNLVASEEEYEYGVADNIQPELNAQIVANGTAKFFKFVPPVSGANRLMRTATKNVEAGATSGQYVLVPILMCNTRHSILSLAAQIFEEDMTITGLVEYRDGVFYRGSVQAGDTFVSYTHDQYMTAEGQNRARKNIDVYHTDKQYRSIFAEYSGFPEKYDKVSSEGGRIYAFVQSETWMKGYNFERVLLDDIDNVYWSYNRDCVCAKIKESGDIFRVCFALQDNAEANVSELDGDPIVFPKAGVWFFADDKPGNVSADTYKEIYVKVPRQFLPEFPSQEDFDKLVMMLKEESERAQEAEKKLADDIDSAVSYEAQERNEVDRMQARHNLDLYRKEFTDIKDEYTWDTAEEPIETITTSTGDQYCKIAYPVPGHDYDKAVLNDVSHKDAMGVAESHSSFFFGDFKAGVIAVLIDNASPVYNQATRFTVALTKGIWVLKQSKVENYGITLLGQNIEYITIPKKFLSGGAMIINAEGTRKVDGYTTIFPDLSYGQIDEIHGYMEQGYPVFIAAAGISRYNIVTEINSIDGKGLSILIGSVLAMYHQDADEKVSLVAVPLGEGGGNYEHLSNKPSIEDVTLEGNKSLPDLGVDEATDEDIDNLFK